MGVQSNVKYIKIYWEHFVNAARYTLEPLLSCVRMTLNIFSVYVLLNRTPLTCLFIARRFYLPGERDRIGEIFIRDFRETGGLR